MFEENENCLRCSEVNLLSNVIGIHSSHEPRYVQYMMS